MANRYWVGGTGTWDASTTVNWSATSGGAGGASAPTLADDVIFDANSDAGGIFTVTLGTGAVCRDITAGSLDFTMTLAGTATWAVHGSLTFPVANLNCTATGVLLFTGNTTGKTITTNGVNYPGNIFIGAVAGGSDSATWTLGSALSCAGRFLEIYSGSLNTNNFNITCGTVDTNFTNTKALILGSSTVTCTSATAFTIANTTNLNFNAGTSTIVCSNGSATFAGGGLTYYNVSFTSTASGTHTITGANTFNNLTFTSLAVTGIRNISIGANQTVNGTLTLGTANTAIRRLFMRSDTIGTPRTITAAAIATLSDVDFRDIVAAGASGTWSGTRLGNCLGNSNITFDASKSVYRIGTGNWSATQWALSSGGAVDVNNFPLAQDDCVFDTSTTTGTHTVDAGWNIGGIDFSALTVAVTWATGSTNSSIYKNITLDSDVTVSGTGSITFAGTSNQTITSSGKTFTQSLTILKNATSVILADAMVSSGTFTLTSGTLDLNNFDLTCLIFSSNNSNTRSIAFGTKKIVVTGNGGTVFNMSNATNFTYTGTSNFEFNYSGSTLTRSIVFGTTAGSTENNAVSINITNGTDLVGIGGSYLNVNYTGFSGTIDNASATLYGNYTTSSTLTVANTSVWTFAKSSGTQTITTNGKTLTFSITKSGAGTLQLLDACTIGSTRSLTHTAGTIDMNDFNLTTGLYSSTGSTARQLDVGAGTFTNSGATFTVSGSNYTTAGTGIISMTSASSKTFAGGGFSYPALNQGGAGALNVTGANTFADITNTVQPCTVIFPANTITNVYHFNLSGTAGNLVTIQSSIAGQRFTLNKVEP